MTAQPRSQRLERVLGVVIAVLLVLGFLTAGLVPLPVVVLSLPFFYLLGFKPVLRRLALGHIRRRPRETALVLLGSLLGTAIITGSFVVGDTLDASISQGVHTQLGPVDVAVPTGEADPATVEAALAPMLGEEIDGTIPVTAAQVTVATVGADGAPDAADPDATLLEVDFERARSFGGEPEATGIEGPTPAEGEAVLGEDLADTLGAEAGTKLRLFAYGEARDLTVTRVLEQRGIAGLQLDSSSGSQSPTVFVRPGLIADLSAAAPDAGEPPFTFVAVSATGGVETVTGESFVDEIQGRLTAAGLVDNVIAAKANLRATADAVGSAFTELFGMIGLFSVFAGILLLVNIFVMLAQERQSELGMLRAVGLTRFGLVGSFSLEGWMYSIGAAALGTVAGLGVGRVIVIVAAGLFAAGGPGGEGGLDLVYTATRASASAGFLIGFLISLVTVLGTSIRISRLNVIRAIRDLPEPAIQKRRVVTLVVGALAVLLGAAVAVGGVRNERAASVLIGPCMVAYGLVPLLSRLLPRRLIVSAAAAAALAWAVFAFGIFPGAFREAAIAVFLIQGIILVASAVALLSQNQSTIGAAVRKVSGAHRMALRLGLAYPLARGFRTSMTLAMYALVVYVLATITIFSSIFGSQIETFTDSISGGFDLIAETNPTNPIPVDELRAVEGVSNVAPIAGAFGEWTPLDVEPGGRGATEPTPWPAGSYDESFISQRAPDLADRPAQYSTDEEAYRAVLANPDLFIPTAFFLEQGGGPPAAPEVGDRYVLRDPTTGQSRTLTVAAVAQSGFGNIRPLMSPETLRSVFGNRALPNVFYIDAADGVSPARLAAQINARFIANGTDAADFKSIVAESLSQQEGFFKLMRGYLALGLVVGIAGLGVVMVRAVRERRREIGVLRALGFDAAAIRRAFLVESGFVAFEGILTGVVLAIITTWRLSSNGDFGNALAFAVPWASLAALVALTIGASLLATATPAHQASRIKPAVALRIAD